MKGYILCIQVYTHENYYRDIYKIRNFLDLWDINNNEFKIPANDQSNFKL